MKNILFCSVSHELRNPINHINGILECISSYVSPGDRIQQFVKIALSSTSMLMHKIDDIMDYSLLETNTLNLRMEEFDIRKMMNYIQDMLLHQFDNKLLNFSIYVADSVPEIVYFDQKRVKQVLINLIFNALKYTERGYVTVIIDCDYPKTLKFKDHDRLHHCTLNFAVSDSGWGIRKKKRMNIFELFQNAKVDRIPVNSDKDVIESSELMGIGLAFCHKILEKMNSRLKLSSVVNVGSTFNFS